MCPWNLDAYPAGSPERERIRLRINELARQHREKHRTEIAERAKKKWREDVELSREKSRQSYLRRAEKERVAARERYYKNRDDPERKARARQTTEKWILAHPERNKELKDQWYQDNKDRIRSEANAEYVPHPRPILAEEEKLQRRIATQRKHRAEHRDEINARRREEWKDPEVRRKWNEARSRRFKENPEFLLRHRLRVRMKHALKGELKAAKTMDLIGCSSADLRKHIESTWTEGMDWTTYGFGAGTWQVDHVRPLVSFQLSDPAQQREAFHWSNLKAEWWEVNSSKSGKWNGVNHGIVKREANRACPPAPEVAQSVP